MILRRRRRRHQYLILALFIVLASGLAAAGMGFMPGPWSTPISKPAWTPPAELFALIWTLLHVLTGLAAWLVWRHHLHRLRWPALAVCLLQLLLGTVWSWTLFGAHQLGWAAASLAAMWLVLAVTVTLFFRVSSLAGSLMVPYLAWSSFALALNFEIWRLNLG